MYMHSSLFTPNMKIANNNNKNIAFVHEYKFTVPKRQF